MKLFEPLAPLRNRIVMAPMTRSRSDAAGVPPPFAADYYGARADAGLILTEGTGPSAMGMGYARTPGIYSPAQIEAWRAVTGAVHAKGGRIFLQIMHVGRIAHAANRTIPDAPVAPSAIRAAGQMWTDTQGMQPNDEPRALETAEIAGVIAEYAQATRNALAAGFDGVELHAASGYLPNQFLATGSNHRTDAYGGPVENRIRFVVETLEAMVAAAGDAAKVSIKVSPGMPFNDLTDADPIATHVALAKAIAPMNLAYLHVMRTGIGAEKALRDAYPGTLLVGGGFTRDEAEATLNAGAADAIVFGSSYIANPDLVERFRRGVELAKPDSSTFYTPGTKGYTDYPAAT
ncbi:MAG: alkene reductase [Bryobacterales bacterium]|nr:alkene reductase [Bryobacterales bacterium]